MCKDVMISFKILQYLTSLQFTNKTHLNYSENWRGFQTSKQKGQPEFRKKEFLSHFLVLHRSKAFLS